MKETEGRERARERKERRKREEKKDGEIMRQQSYLGRIVQLETRFNA